MVLLLQDLPQELLTSIISFLGLKGMVEAAQSCRMMYDISCCLAILTKLLENNKVEFDVRRYNDEILAERATPIKKPSIVRMVHSGIIESDTPAAIARFLVSSKYLGFTGVGTYLAEHGDVRAEFVKLLDFKDMFICDALRKFVGLFSLPGEASYIAKLLESFADQYYEHNPHLFTNKDTPFTLAYSVVMINTDMYSDNVKSKMNRDTFIRNLRQIDNGEVLPNDYVAQIYDYVSAAPYLHVGGVGTQSWLNTSFDNKRHSRKFVVLNGLSLSIYPNRKEKAQTTLHLLDYDVETLPNNTFKLTLKHTSSKSSSSSNNNNNTSNTILKLFAKEELGTPKEIYFSTSQGIPALTYAERVEKNVNAHYADVLYKRVLKHKIQCK